MSIGGLSNSSGISASPTASLAAVAARAAIDTDNRRQLLASVAQNSTQEATTNATTITISAAANSEASSSSEKTTQQSTPQSTQLSAEQEAQLAKLQARDRQVRQHEMAHLAASGGLATSGASYVYQKGPDGVNYAVGGEVSIDTSPGRTPEDTIARARQIQAAALAPADPSGQDRSVAAQAQHMEIEARAQLATQASADMAVKSTEQDSLPPAFDPAQQKIGQLQQAYGINTNNSSIDVYA